jgi:para-nitrobenzyl esterase
MLLPLSFLSAASPDPVKVREGMLKGVPLEGGIIAYLGIPYAAPPVGALRWKPPQPAAPWQGLREAAQFGPRPHQPTLWKDIIFRSPKASEDCLYLNVWAPAAAAARKLPVLVYFHGGGLVVGDGSEARYDGAALARRGLVTVTVNYRLGIFGFLSHPELSAESPAKASGNYGLLDQVAALRWVRDNIAAFGGDPARITIGGESAGSISVSALMASPLSRDLLAGAIGESGSLLGTMTPSTLAQAEAAGVQFAKAIKKASLAELRALPAEELLAAALKANANEGDIVIDGVLLVEDPALTYREGRQARIPLLAGWTSAEMDPGMVLTGKEPTTEVFLAALDRLFGAQAPAVARVYPHATPAEVLQSATDLSSDLFIAQSTWKWTDQHARSSGKPVYRFLYSQMLPPQVLSEWGPDAKPSAPRLGAPHAADIPYFLGNLPLVKLWAWTPSDHAASERIQAYVLRFVQTGNPNPAEATEWPALQADKPVEMVLAEKCQARPAPDLERRRVMDTLAGH